MKTNGYEHAWREMYTKVNAHLFFYPKDSRNIAGNECYNYLVNDYKFFRDVYANMIPITKLSIYDTSKINDLKKIIWFINPIDKSNKKRLHTNGLVLLKLDALMT